MQTDHYDSPWKDIVQRYFRDFMAYFFPHAEVDIDWSRGYQALDKELEQVVRDAELGKRFADKLFRVWRRNGKIQIVLIHIEVQGRYDREFTKRMHIYNYRLFDRYDQPVVSLAVLTDGNTRWRPKRYRRTLWGYRTETTFPVVKLLDYATSQGELEASDNPFAIVVAAHLQTQATRNRPAERLDRKLALTKQLYEHGWQRSDVLELYRFLDWLLRLPDELDQQFKQQLLDYEAHMSNPYITTIERQGIQQGLEQGLEQGIQQGLEQGRQQTLKAGRRLLMRQARKRFDGETALTLEPLLGQITSVEEIARVGEWLVDYEDGQKLIDSVQKLLTPDREGCD